MSRFLRIPLVLGLLLGGALLLGACSDDDGGDADTGDTDTTATTTASTTATSDAGGDSDSTATTTATASTTATSEAGGSDSGDGDGSSVAVTLSDFAIAVDPDSAAAGEVTFTAENTGAVEHELVVIKSDEAPDALPVDGATVDEEQVDIIGEIEPFPAGETEEGTFDLEAGDYVLICNVAGHYQLGMHTAFTVE